MNKKHVIIFSTLCISSILAGVTLGAIVTKQQRIGGSTSIDISLNVPEPYNKTHTPSSSPFFKKNHGGDKIFKW